MISGSLICTILRLSRGEEYLGQEQSRPLEHFLVFPLSAAYSMCSEAIIMKVTLTSYQPSSNPLVC